MRDPQYVMARTVLLKGHFADARAAGSQMAARAVGALMSSDEVAESCATLTLDLLRAISDEG